MANLFIQTVEVQLLLNVNFQIKLFNGLSDELSLV